MPRGENRPSVLLTAEENDQVFGLIGPKCLSLATAVVQLFTTEGPGHTEWKKKDTGILCLIKDNSRRSYFFRIYCLYRKSLVWEQEVYMQIEYKSPRPYLHTFEAEDYMTAFNFASEEEARNLRNTLIEKIELRKNRREERRNRAMAAARASGGGGGGGGGGAPALPAPRTHNGVAAHAPPGLNNKQPAANTNNYNTLKNANKKPKTRKLTKADIGMPHDFKHISHVGWDAKKGFDVDMDNLPEEEMKTFFSKAGVSETQLQDHATRQFIYDFIHSHGGLDAVKEELHDVKPESGRGRGAAPPVPARAPPPALPPAPPSRAPPPPPARAVPPPPAPPAPPAPRHPPPPRPTPPSTAPPAAPPPPPPGAPPPPPPPPPPPQLAPPPPAPPAASPAAPPPGADPRAALMESIRCGNKNLKHVEVGQKPSTDDSRSNLLSEIRQGVELRSVSRSDSAAGGATPGAAGAGAGAGGGDGLAGALARALHERSRAIHSSDSELSDDETTSDGEWDD